MADVNNAPISVTVVFPRSDNGVVGDLRHVETVTALTGYTGTHIVHTTAIASYSGGVLTNDAEVTALAEKIAADFYAWRLASIEIRYESAVPWISDGMHDIEFMHGAAIVTAVHRSEWEPEFGELQHHGNAVITEFSGEGWATCTISGGILSLRSQEGVAEVLRLAAGQYYVVFDTDFGDPYCFQWSGNGGNQTAFLKELARTSNSVLLGTSTGADVDVFGIDFRGKLCDPTMSGSGVSGSGNPLSDWWCVQVSQCTDSDCIDCEEESSVECVVAPFSDPEEFRCIPNGDGTYRREVALSGPYATMSGCSEVCEFEGGVVTGCCNENPIPISLCANLSNGSFLECANGGVVPLSYQGLVTTGNPRIVDPVHMWEGEGDFGSCGHPIRIQAYCAQPAPTLICGSCGGGLLSSLTPGIWTVVIMWPDGCSVTETFDSCCTTPEDTGYVNVVSCKPLHLHVDRGGGNTCGGSMSATEFNVDIVPGCGSSDLPVIEPDLSAICTDGVSLTISGVDFDDLVSVEVFDSASSPVGVTVGSGSSTSITVSLFDIGLTETGLVADWEFEGGLTDSSGNGHTLTSGGGLSYVAGVVGQGLQTTCAAPATTTISPLSAAFTFAAWIKCAAAPGDPEGIISSRIQAQALIIDPSGEVEFWADPATPLSTGVDVCDDVKRHLVGTWDGTTAKLYLDGTLVDSAASAFAAPGGDDFEVGGANGSATFMIDSAKVYSRALTAAEVLALASESRATYPVPPNMAVGAVTAIVTTDAGASDEAQVATAVDCSTPIWLDTFTGGAGALTSHTPDVSPGGAGYTDPYVLSSSVFRLTGAGKLGETAGGSDGGANIRFNPGQANAKLSIDFVFNSAVADFELSIGGRGGALTGGFLPCGVLLLFNGVDVDFTVGDSSVGDTDTLTLVNGNTYTLEVEITETYIRATCDGVTVRIDSTESAGNTIWEIYAVQGNMDPANSYILDNLEVTNWS